MAHDLWRDTFDEQPVRTCRGCGCTADDACQDDAGARCWWVELDRCSACLPDTPLFGSVVLRSGP